MFEVPLKYTSPFRTTGEPNEYVTSAGLSFNLDHSNDIGNSNSCFISYINNECILDIVLVTVSNNFNQIYSLHVVHTIKLHVTTYNTQ